MRLLVWPVEVLASLVVRLLRLVAWLVDRPAITVPVGLSVVVGLWAGGLWAIPAAWLAVVASAVVWAWRWPASYGRYVGSWLLARWQRLLAWAGRFRWGARAALVDPPPVTERPAGGVRTAPPGVVGQVGCAHVIRDAAACCARCRARVVAVADPDDPGRLVWFDDLEVG